MSAVLARFPKYDVRQERDPVYNISCLLDLYTTNMVGEANLDEFIETLKFIFAQNAQGENTEVLCQGGTSLFSMEYKSLLAFVIHNLLAQLAQSQQAVKHSSVGIPAWQHGMVLEAQKKKPKINPSKCYGALWKLAQVYPAHRAFKQSARVATEVLLVPRLNGREFDLEKQADGSHKITGPKSSYYSSRKEYLIDTGDLRLLALFYGPKLQVKITQAGDNTEPVLAELTQLIMDTLLSVGTKTLYVRDIVTNGPGISYGGWGVPMSVESRPVEVPEVRFNSDKLADFVAFFDEPPALAVPVPVVSSKPAVPAASSQPVPAVPVVVPVPDDTTVADQVLGAPASPAMTPLAETAATPRRGAGPNTAAKAEVQALDDDMHRDQPTLHVDWWGCRFM